MFTISGQTRFEILPEMSPDPIEHSLSLTQKPGYQSICRNVGKVTLCLACHVPIAQAPIQATHIGAFRPWFIHRRQPTNDPFASLIACHVDWGIRSRDHHQGSDLVSPMSTISHIWKFLLIPLPRSGPPPDATIFSRWSNPILLRHVPPSKCDSLLYLSFVIVGSSFCTIADVNVGPQG